MAHLVALDGDLNGTRFALDAPCLVGRGPLNHVVLDDPRISRQHAKISPESGGHIVYDLNSANGTFVNDVQVKRHRLAPSDVVRFGPFRFLFEAAQALEHPQVKSAPRIFEVRTLDGIEVPAKIVDSLDAAQAAAAPIAGLGELESADRKLRTLYAFMQSISTTFETQGLLDQIAANLLSVFPEAEVVGVHLRDPGTNAMVPRKTQRRDAAPAPPVPMAMQFHEEVVHKGRAVLSAPFALPTRKARPAPVGRGLTMHAPMIYRGDTSGVIMVQGADASGAPFTQRDLDLLTGLSAVAALALQNARLYAESLKQQRLAQDLLFAEQIQKSFLPRQLPSVPGIDFVTQYQPAYSVGGDFYDVFWLTKHRLGVFIGDVAGKGVSAALLMARISSDLRVAALAESEPARVVARVNHAVLEREQHDIFVTGIYLSLDVRTRHMVLANAGHLPPLIRRRAERVVERIDGGSATAIGFFEGETYEQVELALDTGDTLVLCTDGVIEATNMTGDQFGMGRLEESMAPGPSAAEDVCARILADVRTHVGDAPVADDLTLIVCGATDRK